MGCSQSKIENEEAVTRCKERKQFMKEAVAARNAFAAAHSAYGMSLKNTGAALSDYAHGEVQNPNLPPPVPSVVVGLPPPQPPMMDTIRPPPPPGTISGDPVVPIQRSASMPIQMPLKGKQRETSTSTIMEDEEEEEDDVEGSDRLVKRRSRNYRGSGSGGRSRREVVEEAEEVEERVTSTKVQAHAMQSQPSLDSAYHFFFPAADSVPGPSLGEVEEVKIENREAQRKFYEETQKRVEEEEMVEKNMREEEEEVILDRGQKAAVDVEKPAPTMAGVGKGSKKGGKVVAGSSGEKRLVKGSFNLLQVFAQLDDHFLKASESAHEVSKMLEANRLHYHSNFADNRGNAFSHLYYEIEH